MADLAKMDLLLSSYYGTQDEEQAVEDAMDVKSAAFKPGTFLQEVLMDKPSAELVQYAKEMERQTRALDSGMQNLVYENYSKFIAATDTVRRMKTSVESMEAEMTRLVASLDSLDGWNSKINTAMTQNRSQIEKLVGVRRLLSKLEFLFELPARLRRSIELAAYAQAVKYFTVASAVLRKHSNVPSFNAIQVEAESIMDGLRAILWRVVKSAHTAPTQLVESVHLLVQLQANEIELLEAFLSWQKQALSAELTTCMMTASSNTDPLEFVANVDRRFLDKLTIAVTTACELFDVGDRSIGAPPELPRVGCNPQQAVTMLSGFVREVFADYFQLVRAQLMEVVCSARVVASAAPAAGGSSSGASGGGEVLASRPIPSAAAAVVDGAAAATPPRAPGAKKPDAAGAATPNSDLDKYMPQLQHYERLVKALKLFVSDVRMVAKAVREPRLEDRTAETVEAVIRKQVGAAFEQVQADLIAEIVSLYDSLQPAAAAAPDARPVFRSDLVALVSRNLVALADRVVLELQPLITCGMQLLPDMARAFVELLRGNLNHFLFWSSVAFETCGDPYIASRRTNRELVVDAHMIVSLAIGAPNAAARRAPPVVSIPKIVPNSEFVLTLACVARSFGIDGVTHVLSVLIEAVTNHERIAGPRGARTFPMAPSTERLTRVVTADDYGSMADVPDLIKRMHAASSQLLSRFVVLQGERIGMMMRTSIEIRDWLDIPEPRDARDVVELVLQEIKSLRDSVRKLLAETSQTAGAVPAPMRPTTGKHLSMYGTVNFTVDSVLVSVIKVMCKTLYEAIRLQTFSRFGYQQVQVDVAVLQLALPSLLQNPEQVQELLDESVASAAERCVDPVAMETSIVFELATNKLIALQLGNFTKPN